MELLGIRICLLTKVEARGKAPARQKQRSWRAKDSHFRVSFYSDFTLKVCGLFLTLFGLNPGLFGFNPALFGFDPTPRG
jgi:hypothetical protein